MENAQATGAQRMDTSQLRPGDLVLNYGMKIRVDAVHAVEDPTSHGGVVYVCPGTVLNVEEAVEIHDIPRSFMWDNERFVHGPGHGREDFWNVQGNDLATWSIVRTEA